MTRWEPTATAEVLERFSDDGILCMGAQLSVSHDGSSVDLAFGRGGPDLACRPDTVWRLYCAAKPVVALAVVLLAVEGRIDLDRPVGEQLASQQLPDGPLASGHVTPRQLLDHTAGLHQLHGFGVGALAADLRHRQVTTLRPPGGWDPGRHAGYSEYAAWHILGLLLDAAGGSVPDLLRTRVTEPMAAGEIWFAMDHQRYDDLYPRLGVPYDLRQPQPTPLLAHRLRRPCTELNTAYGAYGTARGLCTLYRSMLDAGRPAHADTAVSGEAGTPRGIGDASGGIGDAARGIDDAAGGIGDAVGWVVDRASVARAVETTVAHRRGRRPDEVLGRSCDFGLGVMVDLASHGFEPDVSPESFGHTGFHGTVVGFADPAVDLAVGLVCNGIVGGDLGVHTRRNAVLRALYRDIGARGGGRHRATGGAGR